MPNTPTIAQRLRSLYDNLVIAINFINDAINLKADKVSSATSGNLAGLDSTGNLTDSGYAPSSFATPAQVNAKADKESVVEITDDGSASSQALSANTLYVFTTRTSDLTLTLTEGETGKVNEYHLFLVIGSTAPTITWPSGISWNGGSAPTIAADKTYEVSILNNVAAYFEV